MLRSVLALMLWSACAAFAQSPGDPPEVKPSFGQAGKDVIWMPTPMELVDKMLDMARAAPDDFLIDLGSGDGRTVIAAARRGVPALGIEFDDDLVAYSRRSAALAGVAGRASFEKSDFFAADLSRASIITMFLLPEINLKLRPSLLALKPGTRIVSNSFRMGDWKPDEAADLNCGSHCIAYLWLVPARVAGRWQTPYGPLAITQTYQTFEGALAGEPTAYGHLRGDVIRFTVRDTEYTGRVSGDRIDGTWTSPERAGSWSATR